MFTASLPADFLSPLSYDQPFGNGTCKDAIRVQKNYSLSFRETVVVCKNGRVELHNSAKMLPGIALECNEKV